jgi:DNA-binding transcriptional regulator YhcF (GntR family)
MRTTVTLDKDVERLLRDEMHRSRKSLKQTLNSAVRSGLSGKMVPAKGKRFVVKARALGMRTGIDPAGLNRMVDELEVESFVEKQGREGSS